MRRDGETLPLLDLVDPPIQVGRRAYLVLGAVSDHSDYLNTTRHTHARGEHPQARVGR